MSDTRTRADDDRPDPAARRIARQSRALAALTEIGLNLAQAVHDQVAAGADGPFHDPALAFSRIARAIRLTIALEARLDDDRTERGRPARDADAGALRQEVDTDAARDAGETPALREPERERLRDREDTSDAALLRLPSGELYALICRDLGQPPEPGLFDASNDDAAAEPPPARSRAIGSGRAAVLQSTAASLLTAPAPAPALKPPPRSPP